MTSKSKLWSFIRLCRRPRLRAETHSGVQTLALPVGECVSRARIILCRCAALLRRISLLADNPPKPWRLRFEASFSAQGRSRVFSWKYHRLCLWGSIFILISGAILLFPVIVNAEYAYRKAITIDHTKVSGTLSNFPVLISITNDNDLKNHVTSANGYDLVFKDGSGTQLYHELERWDGSTGTLVAWVRIPALSSATDTVIYMWYGDSGVTTSQENKTGVWDSNYKGVWHLPNGTTLSLYDSTSNANNGTNHGATGIAGKIGGAANFNGTNQYVAVTNNSGLNFGSGNFTLSLWVKSTGSTGSNQAILAKACGGGTPGYQLYLLSGGSYQPYIGDGTHGAYFSSATSSYLADNQWHNLVMVRNGSNLRLYVDGVEDANSPANASSVGSVTNSRDLFVAQQPVGNSPSSPNTGQYFKGLTDEVRVSNVARTADWILTEYRNQSLPSTFYTVGSETLMLDTTAPVVTAFVIPNLYNNLTIPITTFTATDNVGVTGYLVNESPSTPSPSDPNWSPTPQTQYTFSSDGNKTLYAWAKDAAGNISSNRSATVSLVLGRRIYIYDDLDRLIQIIYEDGRRVTYTYDAAGNRITVINE